MANFEFDWIQDVDGSGSINLDEFVKVQGIASQLYGTAAVKKQKQELVEQYLQARAPGEVQQYGGGLGFEAGACFSQGVL